MLKNFLRILLQITILLQNIERHLSIKNYFQYESDFILLKSKAKKEQENKRTQVLLKSPKKPNPTPFERNFPLYSPFDTVELTRK